MKIIHLVGGDEDIGGVLSVLRNLQSATQNRGWRHEVLVGKRYQESRKPPLNYVHAATSCEETDNHLKMFFQVAGALLELKKLILRNGYDVIHSHSRSGLIMSVGLSRLLKKEILFTNHNYAQNRKLYTWAAAQPRIRTALLTPNMAKHYGIEVDYERVHIVSDCCPDAFFHKSLTAVGGKAEGEANEVRLIGTGNIVGWKKWLLIVEALALMDASLRKKICVEIWGPTPGTIQASQFHQRILDRVRETGLEDRFQLKGPTHEVDSVLSRADWFILPSTNEPCSVALSEALSLGLPAIVSRSGGCVDMVHEGKSGMFFNPDDASDLALRLEDTARGFKVKWSPEEIRESVRQRSASKVAELYGEVYKLMIQEH